MKRYILFTLLLLFTIGLSAQKSVRQAVRKGNNAYKEQRYSAAEEDYAKALEENASSKEASFNLANTYYKQKRWDDALKEYQHYLTLENQNPKKMSAAWSNMGNTFLKKKADEKNQMQGMPGQGQQQQAQDNLKMSMEAYKNALRLNPQDDETRENLAIVQKMIKDQEGGGGGDGQDNQDKDDKQQEQQQQEQNQNQDKQDEKKDDQQNENQMSQENIQQILEAIEQQEKETQERVNQVKADEKKRQMEKNRRQDKDW